jgi:ABC-type thiamin/hydroxymethylpyrimidine transport system permease subunit
MIFVWTLQDIIAVSFIGILFGGFILFWAVIYVLVAIDAIKKKWRSLWKRARA